MAPIPVFSSAIAEALAKALAEAMTSPDMTSLLAEGGMGDPHGPKATKWRRLLAAFQATQSRDGCANALVAFTRNALEPARFIGRADKHAIALDEVNHALAFAGLAVNDRAEIQQVAAACTLAEAEERAGRLRAELRRRRVHADVLRACRAELLEENNFHAVLEATKSVATKVRARSGLTSDGSELVDAACAIGKAGVPIVAFNSRRTDSERSEHNGILSLMKGMFGTFRNPTAHAPKSDWEVAEDDALDLLTLASFLHRRLDAAVRTHRTM